MQPLFRTDVEIRGVVVQVISNIADELENKTSKRQSMGLERLIFFAGVGGIRLGFEKAGFKTVFANDFESQCKDTYDLNFKDSKLVIEDIRKIGIDDLPKFDFYWAVFLAKLFRLLDIGRDLMTRKAEETFF